jgi:hypothetical protein
MMMTGTAASLLAVVQMVWAGDGKLKFPRQIFESSASL